MNIKILNYLKLSICFIVGGFLGVKLLVGFEPLKVLLFVILCNLGGIILAKVGGDDSEKK